jgi:hypothetical protein
MNVHRFATLTAAALLSGVVSAAAQTINIFDLDNGGRLRRTSRTKG